MVTEENTCMIYVCQRCLSDKNDTPLSTDNEKRANLGWKQSVHLLLNGVGKVDLDPQVHDNVIYKPLAGIFNPMTDSHHLRHATHTHTDFLWVSLISWLSLAGLASEGG